MIGADNADIVAATHGREEKLANDLAPFRTDGNVNRAYGLLGGDADGVEKFRKGMEAVGMPTTLFACGVETTDETMAMYYDKIVNSSAMVGTDAGEQARLREVLELIR